MDLTCTDYRKLFTIMDFQGPGDLWYFPPGFPHSLQATNQTEDGAEFLLVCLTSSCIQKTKLIVR